MISIKDERLGPDAPRYVFVGGLHRSGTSLTARLVGGLPGVGFIEGAPVPENEGVYLQGAIPHDRLSGQPMAFATDPAQHMTEASRFNTLATAERLHAEWAPWYPPDTRWRVEKSPVNLTRMRLLQQLFPLSQFIVVIRHPEAVAAAVAKWMDRPAPDLMDHWVQAHMRLLDDVARLHRVMVLRYEDLVARSDVTLSAVAAFLDIEHAGSVDCGAIRNGNAEYAGCTPLSQMQEEQVRRWGYARNLQCDADWRPIVQHPLRAVQEATDAILSTR